MYNQTNEFIHLGGNVNHNADLSIEVDRRIGNGWCSFRKYTLKLYDRPSTPLELNIRMLTAEVLRHAESARVRLRHAAPSSPERPDLLNRLAKKWSHRPDNFLSGHPYEDAKWEDLRWFCAGGGSCLRDLWRAWRIRDCRRASCSENWWRARTAWEGRKKSGWGVSWTISELSVSTLTSGRLKPTGRGGIAQDGGIRRRTFHGEMDRCRESQDWITICSSMPKRDGKGQREDSPKQACSYLFARHSCCLATSCANLYASGVFCLQTS